MKHLTDSREPITVRDVDQAIRDARWWLGEDDSATGPGFAGSLDDLIARLLAIVEDSYGYE